MLPRLTAPTIDASQICWVGQCHYFGRFIHAVAFRRFVFCSMGIAEVVVEDDAELTRYQREHVAARCMRCVGGLDPALDMRWPRQCCRLSTIKSCV
jgi:hypothetical protein